MAGKRHSWDDPVRFERKTERACKKGCGVVRVTRHEPGELPWVEFWRGLDRIDADGRTPPCVPAAAEPAAE